MKVGDKVRIKELAPEMRHMYALKPTYQGFRGRIVQEQMIAGFWAVKFDLTEWPDPPGALLPESLLELDETI